MRSLFKKNFYNKFFKLKPNYYNFINSGKNYSANKTKDNDLLNQSYLNIEKKFMEKIKIKNIQYFRIFLTVGLGAVIIIVLFGNEIKKYFGKQSADIAVIALQDKDVHNKADNVAKEILTSILTDKDTMEKATQFVISLCNDPQIKNKLLELILYTLNTKEVNESVKQLTINLINNNYVKEQLINLVFIALFDDKILNKFNEELNKSAKLILKDKKIHEESIKYLNNIIEDKNLIDKSSEQLKFLALNLLTLGYYKKSKE